MTTRREAIRDGLEHRLTAGLHLGSLSPGERLGSARHTAREVGADYRLIVEALRGLERDGLLEIRPRGGACVGRRAAAAAPSRRARLGDRLADFLVDELDGGLPPAMVADGLRHCLDSRGLRAACIECNFDQLDFLCEELAEGF